MTQCVVLLSQGSDIRHSGPLLTTPRTVTGYSDTMTLQAVRLSYGAYKPA